MKRTIAIGDIHGCSIALSAIIEAIGPTVDDTLVFLGDYVDRGIDSKGVLDQLIALPNRCKVVTILGNHEEMMVHALSSRSDFQFWLNCGGDSALDSYGSSSQIDLIPPAHIRFLKSCIPYFETDSHIFLHANYLPEIPLAELDDQMLRWKSLRDYTPSERHYSGKVAVVGHTPHDEIFDNGYLVCLDTRAWDGGWLSAMDVTSGEIWQTNERGDLR